MLLLLYFIFHIITYQCFWYWLLKHHSQYLLDGTLKSELYSSHEFLVSVLAFNIITKCIYVVYLFDEFLHFIGSVTFDSLF